jgi:methylmalonyl-CoA/ethylmalonyl-CoA epimerase
MNESEFKLPHLSHVGVVTRDLEKTIGEMQKLHNLSPFKILEPEYTNTHLRGKPTDFKLKSAFYQSGQVVIEIISVIKGDSLFSEWLREKGEGLHHLGYDIQNIDEWLHHYETKGIGILQSGERPGVKWAYLDTTCYTGLIVELVERTAEGKLIK